MVNLQLCQGVARQSLWFARFKFPFTQNPILYFLGAQKIKIIAHNQKWAGGHGLNGEMSAPEGGRRRWEIGWERGEGGASELGGDGPGTTDGGGYCRGN